MSKRVSWHVNMFSARKQQTSLLGILRLLTASHCCCIQQGQRCSIVRHDCSSSMSESQRRSKGCATSADDAAGHAEAEAPTEASLLLLLLLPLSLLARCTRRSTAACSALRCAESNVNGKHRCCLFFSVAAKRVALSMSRGGGCGGGAATGECAASVSNRSSVIRDGSAGNAEMFD